MDKAEELKHKAKVEFFGHEIKYQFTKSELDEYAQQVSKEVAIGFGRWKQPSRYELMPSDFADYIEWKSNQEESNG